MSFRITTNGMFRNYRTNLQNNTKKLNDAMNTVETGRAFNAYAEDPAAANEAFQLRRNYWRTGEQIDNSNYLISKNQSAWDALDAIVDGNAENPGLTGIETALNALNGPAGGSRRILGTTLISTAESVMKLMNTQYSGEFVFAGADGLNVPFSWGKGDVLLYRGVDVSAGRPLTEEEFNALKDGENLNAATVSGYRQFARDVYKKFIVTPEDEAAAAERDEVITTPAGLERVESFNDATFADYKKWYVDSFVQEAKTNEDGSVDYDASFAKAAKPFTEATYVDIGIGMKADETGEVIPSSAYNSALNGVEFLGSGVDEDGDSKNIIMLMRQLGKVFERCDATTGEYPSSALREEANRLTGKLIDAIHTTQEEHVKLDASTHYLQVNLKQLTEARTSMNIQIEELEMEDPAKAIGDMMWAQYTYNAALRIGNSILSQTLFDFLSL